MIRVAKKPNLTPEDIAAFHHAVKGTKPLIHQKKIPLTPSHSFIPVKQKIDKKAIVHLNESEDLDSVESDEFIIYNHESISNKTLRKLRKGQYNIDAILDLHGMSVEKARTAVENFLQQCLHEKIRVVLIIHGKGRRGQMPILKNKLNQWLRKIDIVLAFCSAGSSHGSRGAIYVILKHIPQSLDPLKKKYGV